MAGERQQAAVINYWELPRISDKQVEEAESTLVDDNELALWSSIVSRLVFEADSKLNIVQERIKQNYSMFVVGRPELLSFCIGDMEREQNGILKPMAFRGVKYGGRMNRFMEGYNCFIMIGSGNFKEYARQLLYVMWRTMLRQNDEDGSLDNRRCLHKIGKAEDLPFRLILCDDAKFQLIEGIGYHIQKEKLVFWSHDDAAQLFKEFVTSKQDRWNDAADILLEHYQVDFHFLRCPTSGKFESFLRQGRGGRVYAVHKKDHESKVYAMKIARNAFDFGEDKIAKTKKEFEFLKKAHELCPEHIVPVVADSMFLGHEEDEANPFVGYLIEGVGEGISSDQVKSNPRIGLSVLHAMVALHNKNIVHGSCRIDNIVIFEHRYCWIDLRIHPELRPFYEHYVQTPSSVKISGEMFAEDLRSLCRSFGLSQRHCSDDLCEQYVDTFHDVRQLDFAKIRRDIMKDIAEDMWRIQFGENW